MTKDKKPVVCRLSGGLGNQMFQYAAARALALRIGAPLILDLSWFSTYDERTFALDSLSISGELYHTPFANVKALARPISRLATPLIRLRFGVPVYKARQFQLDPHMMRLEDGVYLKGYWQSEKYFDQADAQIRADFQCVRPFTSDRQKVVDHIATKNAISVHVRRGDYVTSAKYNAVHGTCSPQWYQLAMEKMAQDVAEPAFFIFSDDPEWARANLPTQWEAHFVEPQNDKRDFEDMHLMSRCQHHIIANSSFSWWGAWLNGSKTKRVIAPAKWFATAQHDTTDLIPESWDKI
jgi:hypothetical protein